MIKKFFACLLLIIIPSFGWAGDHCTNPGEYTVDKRCYVTLDQRQTKPYNAVVALVDNDRGVYCTGTIIKKDGFLDVYTAKHCVINKKTDVLANIIKIWTQDYQELAANKYKTGDFYYDNVIVDDKTNKKITVGMNLSGDWAIYRLGMQGANIDSVNIAKNKLGDSYDARVIGYGGLKIMSDKEIEDFQKKYIGFLKTKGLDSLVDTKNGVNMFEDFADDLVEELKSQDWIDAWDLFENNDILKVSKCKYFNDGRKIGCQIWGGDSGGGIFDNDGNLMGIVTRGSGKIGGSNHAGKETKMFESYINKTHINLLK